MDVAYKYDILKQICNVAKSVVFIDHHVTIHEDVKRLKSELKKNNKSNLEIIYDEQECGSSLTWKYFNKETPMPLFVKYIKDNDIGQWKLKHTHEFIASLEVEFETNLKRESIRKWNSLFKTHVVNKLIKKGVIYREYINYLSGENAKRYSMEAFPSEKIYKDLSEYFNKPGEYKVAVFCGGGCPSATVLGLKMLETIKCDFVMMWNLNLDRKEYVISFRSKNTDVGRIASAFGGGGHTLASACSFPMSRYNIQDLFFQNSLPRMSA
jgi:oligoribonuclease NrnB/cAMP/cGMP phosphodiesterase (DHH superfamily)